jgi:N-methylhydantoinase B
MDHGRCGPLGALGGADGGLNKVLVHRGGKDYIPPHLSKDQDIAIAPGDRVTVSTPGGGGFGTPFERPAELVARDVRRGYFTREDAEVRFGVVLDEALQLDSTATARCRALS